LLTAGSVLRLFRADDFFKTGVSCRSLAAIFFVAIVHKISEALAGSCKKLLS